MAEEFRTPQSANEAALQNWAGANNELRAPQSRIEKLLLAILGEDVTPDPPQSVNEELLTQIYEQGTGKPEQSKTVSLDMASGDQVIVPDEDYTLSQVTIEKPATLVPQNIKENINIGGVIGSFSSSSPFELIHRTKTYHFGDTLTNEDVAIMQSIVDDDTMCFVIGEKDGVEFQATEIQFLYLNGTASTVAGVNRAIITPDGVTKRAGHYSFNNGFPNPFSYAIYDKAGVTTWLDGFRFEIYKYNH